MDDGLDLTLEATLRRTLERDVAVAIRQLHLPVLPGQLRNEFNHLCAKYSIHQCATMISSFKGNEIIQEARVKLIQENIEKYAEKIIQELKELQKNNQMGELLCRIKSAFHNAVQFLVDSRERTQLFSDLQCYLDEPLKQIKDSLPVEYRVKLNTSITIPPFQPSMPQCEPSPPLALKHHSPRLKHTFQSLYLYQ